MIRPGRKQTNWQPHGYQGFGFFIHGLWSGSPPDTRGRSPVRKSRTPGSVRGVSGNGYPYRDIFRWSEVVPMFLIPMENPEKIAIPLFLERCAAGFPSPAQDYTSSELDLNDYCIRHPSATYFVRAQGNSMQDVGMRDGDLLVVDRSLRPQHRDIVIAEVDGGFTVKQLQTTPRLALLPMNNAYSPIYPDPDELTIFGVVTHWVHRARGNL